MTASPRWIPDDGELDAVARTLDAPAPSHDQAEQMRTSLLAAAATRTQLPRTRPWRAIAFAGAFAAAAAVIVWLVVRPSAPQLSARVTITPIGASHYTRTHGWPDYVVALDDGAVAVEVATLAPGERFRIATKDAEVEVRGSRFEVSAAHDRIATVLVHEGRVELRVKDQQVVMLAAGESWSATRTAQRDEIVREPAVTPPAPATPIVAAEPTRKAPLKQPAPKAVVHPHVQAASEAPVASHQQQPAATPAPPTPTPTAPPPLVAPQTSAPRAGEGEFRAGWAALRANDASAAAKAFATACSEAQHDALGEDACFWAGAAAKRAGDDATARTALEKFVTTFPSSARVPEASALLGWLLYDTGDLDAAQARFERAVNDRVPKVRDSATRGLEAIRRKRTP